MAAQLLSCMYYGMFLVAYLTLVGGIVVVAQPSALRSRLPLLVGAAAMALLLFAPAGKAYLSAHEVVGANVHIGKVLLVVE